MRLRRPPERREPVPVVGCRHCRHAVRLERAAESVPQVASAALRRAAFERSLCGHGGRL